MLKSFNPNKDIWSVLGMGVADKENKWIFGYLLIKYSFWSTPNFCSSSITNVPKLLNSISFLKRLCVAISTWTSPDFNESKISFLSLTEVNLDRDATLILKIENLSLKVLVCCIASKVVGTTITNWKPDKYVAQAILNATSVLPNPTSPHIRRLAGFSSLKSFKDCSIEFNWSSVSTNGNCLLNFSRSELLYWNSLILIVDLLAAFFNNLFARNLIFFFTDVFLNNQSFVPNLSRRRLLSSKPYLEIKFKFSIGNKSLSLPR